MESSSPILLSSPAELAPAGEKFVLAFGVFDGVHLGHQAILKQLCALAEAHHAKPAVLFFHPSPKAVLFPEHPPKMLYPFGEKLRLFVQFGIHHVIAFPFTKELSQLSPEEFLEQHLFSAGVNLAGFCVGDDWRFGAGNSGNAELLKHLAEAQGLQVEIVPAQMQGGTPISSTRIRSAIQQGDFSEASALLGRPWKICGTVVRGLGFAGPGLERPTANIDDPELQLPPWGIYAARAVIAGETAPVQGIIYIGDAPTIRDGESKVLVELHLFDFKGNLYGQEIQIQPVKFLRKSCKFPDAASLKAQIEKDIRQAQEILRNS